MGSLCSRRAHWQEEDSRRAHWQEEDRPPVPKAPRYAGNGRFWSPRGTRLRPSTFGSDEFVAGEFDPNSYRTGQFIVDDDDDDDYLLGPATSSEEALEEPQRRRTISSATTSGDQDHQ